MRAGRRPWPREVHVNARAGLAELEERAESLGLEPPIYFDVLKGHTEVTETEDEIEIVFEFVIYGPKRFDRPPYSTKAPPGSPDQILFG